MADPLPQNWITIKDEATGIHADFPHRPLEMVFDVPLENLSSLGHMKIYTAPFQFSTLILMTYNSPQINPYFLEKEHFYHFFDQIVVPHLFFDPNLFHQQQSFHYQVKVIEGKPTAFYQVTYVDHGTKKKLEGIAKIQGTFLSTSFYIASEDHYDAELANRFLYRK